MIFVSTSAFAESWIAAKVGLGFETAGSGIALEARHDRVGAVLGVGYPVGRDKLASALTAKYEFFSSDKSRFTLALGYGLIDLMAEIDDTAVFETAYAYGPYMMIGAFNLWGPILGDYSLGIGYAPKYNTLTLAVQISIGYALRIHRDIEVRYE